MTDPIRHDLASFDTPAEAHQFDLCFQALFGVACRTELQVESANESPRTVVYVELQKLYLPRRLIAFTVAWAEARTQSRVILLAIDHNDMHTAYRMKL